ncbi:MAG TPA: beta-galactosidase [Terriglobales bacterium]|nr:beta-galactosidase [Terriglobales bacterium]
MHKRFFAILLAALLAAANLCWAAQNKQAKPTSPASQQQATTAIVPVPKLVLGAAWYPEHWEESRWEQDLSLMQAAGINMVRVAEFAWSRLEPQEGRFDFDWLERAIALAAKHKMTVVLGTPSAAPPAWLTQKYPETLGVWEDGSRAVHGNRVHYRFTSAKYLELSRRVAEEMGKRFGHNPNVIGWQIDNEIGSVSYDEDTRAKFQAFLKDRYRTLDALNKAWSTDYWSQTYDNWAQIPIPVGYHNPGLMLDWKRFVTATFVTYQRIQVQALRAQIDPKQFITHNFMGFNGNFDHYEMTKDLDFASWDNYVPTGHLDPLWNGKVHDLTRGFKRQNYWVMETQPGSVNWGAINTALDRGEVRRMAWEAIGHGADAVSYWQWRSALGGQEQIHGSLVGPDGRPRPIYTEISQLGKEFAKAADVIHGTTPKPQAAILFDYDSRWAVEFQRHHKDFNPVNYLHTFYRPLRTLAQDVDIVHPSAPLAQYKLVIAPALNVLPPATAQHLVEYVKGGGHLVIGARSGMKDVNNALLPSRQPGEALSKLLGGDVVEFFALEKNVPVSGEVANGEVTIWAEMLETTAPDTEVLVRFGKSNGWLDGQPAVISRKVGAGRVTYVGGQFDNAVMSGLTKWMVATSGVNPVLKDAPEGVEICRRVGDNRTVLIAINHTAQPQSLTLPSAMREVLKGTAASTTVALAPSDVAVLVSEQK